MATSKRAAARPTPSKPRASTTAAAASRPADSQVVDQDFDKGSLIGSVIAIPLLNDIRNAAGTPGPEPLHAVIIDLHLQYPEGRDAARLRVRTLVDEIAGEMAKAWRLERRPQGLNQPKCALSQQYLFGTFSARFLQELVRRDKAASADAPRSAIYRIWPDFEVKALTDRSISTVKADAAFNSFSTTGSGIVWAVLDSGIDATHPHFDLHDNLNLASVTPLKHADFTGKDQDDENSALVDRFGHGTHVAGIIAGETAVGGPLIKAATRVRDETGAVTEKFRNPPRISGMAPRCTLLSLKVLDKDGRGQASSLIAALEHVQQLNNHGRYVRVHGVNLSVGYNFDPEWFACGQSPLCVEVDRLVRSGVVVVVAAGNTGYGTAQSQSRGAVSAGLDLTINDPGNADLAITVGSTHRDMPHVYGVSYFSSKGPTGDGRAKPDLVAPGEKIVSCDAAWRYPGAAAEDEMAQATVAAQKAAHLAALRARVEKWKPAPAAAPGHAARAAKIAIPAVAAARATASFREDSGTSMAAPHVSGVIAAFLSVRREFVGRPEKVKDLFVGTATDLRRDRYFQGAGLVDLMRAIQSV